MKIPFTKVQIPFTTFLLGPTVLYCLGFVANWLPMAANNGQMPVLMPGGCAPDIMEGDIIHTCMTHASKLKFLGDWINLHHLKMIASPGDLLILQYDTTFIPALCIWAALMIFSASIPLSSRENSNYTF